MTDREFEILKEKIQVAKWMLNAYQLEYKKETGKLYLAGPGNPKLRHLATQQVLRDLKGVAV